jgi:hypothetical protein
MRPPHSRFAATIIVGLFVAAACSSAATQIPVARPTPSSIVARSTPATGASSAPLVTPLPTPGAGRSASPSRSADATFRIVDLTAILEVAEADRFETFGDQSIRLEQVWSPRDTGLGGTCGATNVPWLECLNLSDWLIQPVADADGCPFTRTVSCYDGPLLDILYEPGLDERLALGDGPVNVIGHFGDPASEGCRPENRAACRDRFVVTAIEQAGG